jgi:hypothetical protein
MNETLFYLCFTTDNGELDLISSHQTHDEAWEELQTLSPILNKKYRYSIKCIASLEDSIEFYAMEQDQLRQEILRRQQERQAVRHARAILRNIRDTLPTVAYKPLTDKLIELTDILDKGERYIDNRNRDLEMYDNCVEQRIKEVALLKAAISSATAANGRAIDILEERSLSYMQCNLGEGNASDRDCIE